MKNKTSWQGMLPTNLAMVMTLYDFVVDAHIALVLDNHRRANPDHPTAQRCQKNFENIRSIFEATTGLDWESTFERLGEVPTVQSWKDYLEETYEN